MADQICPVCKAITPMMPHFCVGTTVGVSHFEYITVAALPSITDNQHPNYYSALFSMWQADGWEIVSVTVLPPLSSGDMCRAIGVLRRSPEHPRAEPAK